MTKPKVWKRPYVNSNLKLLNLFCTETKELLFIISSVLYGDTKMLEKTM